MGRLATFLAAIMSPLVPISVHAEDTYFMASGEEHGKPLIFRSMTTVPVGVHEADLPNRVIIRWRYETDLNGMPAADSYSRQNALEDALMPLDVNAIGRQVIVVTGDDRKEWHWYVKDFDSWMAELNRKLAASSAYPIEISHTYEPEWSSFKSFLAEVKRS